MFAINVMQLSRVPAPIGLPLLIILLVTAVLNVVICVVIALWRSRLCRSSLLYTETTVTVPGRQPQHVVNQMRSNGDVVCGILTIGILYT